MKLHVYPALSKTYLEPTYIQEPKLKRPHCNCNAKRRHEAKVAEVQDHISGMGV